MQREGSTGNIALDRADARGNVAWLGAARGYQKLYPFEFALSKSGRPLSSLDRRVPGLLPWIQQLIAKRESPNSFRRAFHGHDFVRCPGKKIRGTAYPGLSIQVHRSLLSLIFSK